MKWLEILIVVIILSLILVLVAMNNKKVDKVGKEIETWDTMIKECEKTLPRNQYCVLIAVPETQVKEK